MNQRRKSNFKNFKVERSNSELIEMLVDQEYQNMVCIYHEIVTHIGRAKNDCTYLEVLAELAKNKEEAITSLACWLSEERCRDISNTVDRLADSIKSAVTAYVKNTELHNN
jgi:hypothetical protein